MLNAIDDVHTDPRYQWWDEVREEAAAANPLRGYCERVYFERTSCKRRSGPRKGKAHRRKTREVELLRFLPSGRCVAVRDLDTPGLDALAEEALNGHHIPPHMTPGQLFLDYFRQL